MTDEQFRYLLPYFISLGFSLAILVFTIARRRVKGVKEFGWFQVGQNLWLIAFLLGLLAKSLTVKIFWDKTQWLVTIISVVAILFFVARFTGVTPRVWKMKLVLLLIVPTLFFIFVATEPIHQFMFIEPGVTQTGPFLDIHHVYTWPPMIYALYGSSLCLGSMVFLIYHGIKTNPLFRTQAIIIAIGVMLPVIGTMLSALNVQVFSGRDPGPFVVALGSLIISWGLFWNNLFDIVPVAREKVFEMMDDMVLILDAGDRVVDINQKALFELRMNQSEVLGRSAYEILAQWPHLLEKFVEPMDVTTEVIFEGREGYNHFDIKSTLMKDGLGNYQGRIFVARDVTKYAQLQWRLQELNENLENRIAEQTKQLAESYETTLEGWAKALELRDKETEGHSRRVVEKTVELARAYGIPESEIEHIRRGAILHDIGKMAVPDAILREKRNLTSEDWEIIKKHPLTAYELLKKIPYLQPAIDIPYCHHEHWDGSGYPRGLRGKQIPVAARLFSVVDVWDALLSNRTYSHAWERENVIKYIKDKSGTEFDPKVVKVFLKMIE
jgi:putative nucleotidyltransferase with HDIG domain